MGIEHSSRSYLGRISQTKIHDHILDVRVFQKLQPWCIIQTLIQLDLYVKLYDQDWKYSISDWTTMPCHLIWDWVAELFGHGYRRQLPAYQLTWFYNFFTLRNSQNLGGGWPFLIVKKFATKNLHILLHAYKNLPLPYLTPHATCRIQLLIFS